jgi:DNA-binding transcriptional MocR family regulator
MKQRRDKGRLAPFVPLLKETISAPAWRAMSHGARSLYVSLKLRYSSNFRNNGQIFLSTRDAAKELGSQRDAVQRWFRELQHYGFIVQTSGGCLGVDGKGKAPHWRLTEIGYMTDPPTRNFTRWNGTPFRKTKKQNPGPESGSTLDPKAGPVVDPKAGPPPARSGPESGSISVAHPGPGSGSISRFTISRLKNGTARSRASRKGKARAKAAPGARAGADASGDALASARRLLDKS